MKKNESIEFYPIGTICYIGTPDDEGHRPIKGEIDHIRLLNHNEIMYSIRWWKENESKNYLAEEEEIDFVGAEKKSVGFTHKGVK